MISLLSFGFLHLLFLTLRYFLYLKFKEVVYTCESMQYLGHLIFHQSFCQGTLITLKKKTTLKKKETMVGRQDEYNLGSQIFLC